ncbi:hypothetical protein BU204_01525 [Actinophytocola xanthii]|uniref:IrrE N-terminal-like domain-containing protein n=1 Tax=Actinophytocola xanthii TaxID=1912961 RepID=A0A1Q8CZ57_9PSEU|nr:hypothetical protein BU204_01525 [Actinophytocola xanthii]
MRFRALTKTPAVRREAVLAASWIAREIAAWISDRYRLPAANVSSLNLPTDASLHDIETIALRVRGQWDLDQRPIPNMVHLLEAHGVRVFSLVQEIRDVDAFSLYIENQPFVFVDTGKTEERQRFDAAHELGHLVMHQGRERAQGRDAERQADRFAAAFLMPRTDILAHNLRNASPDQLIEASRRWRVSAMPLAHRLAERGLLTEWRYRSACVELAKRGYRPCLSTKYCPRHHFTTRDEARQVVRNWVVDFCNRRRRDSFCGMQSAIGYETSAANRAAYRSPP